jgi:hypothetical protein
MVPAMRHLRNSRGSRSRSQDLMHQYVGARCEMIAIHVAGPFPPKDQGNQYLLIAMDYFTKFPKVYAIPNQEESTVAEALVTNFFCRFGSTARATQPSGPLLRVPPNSGRVGTPRSEQGMHHTPAPAIRRHGGALRQNGRGTPAKSHRTRGIGTQDYPSSSLLTGHPLTTLRA